MLQIVNWPVVKNHHHTGLPEPGSAGRSSCSACLLLLDSDRAGAVLRGPDGERVNACGVFLFFHESDSRRFFGFFS